MDELSFQEISARLGKTEVNVRKMLSRSLTKLKATLAGGKGEVR
jgi:DNA-directed RNA polymerase specialized sigma24 family protein